MYNTDTLSLCTIYLNEPTVLLTNTINQPTVPPTYLGQLLPSHDGPRHRPHQGHVEAAIDFRQQFGFWGGLADGKQRSEPGKNTLSLLRPIAIHECVNYFHSKPSTNMADNKATNAIKAHASCDHERALLQSIPRTKGK